MGTTASTTTRGVPAPPRPTLRDRAANAVRWVVLWAALVRLAVRGALAFRADLAASFAVALAGAGTSLATLAVVTAQVDGIAGWSPGAAVVLLGTFHLVGGIRRACVEPNLEWFGGRVVDGRFDEVLVKPAPSLLLASLGGCAPAAFTEVVMGAGIVVMGLALHGEPPSVAGVALWCALTAAACVVMWAIRVLVAAVALWARGLAFDVVYDAVWEFGRYPVGLYPRGLRRVFTYLVPVGLVATVPAGALVGRTGATTALAAVGAAAGFGAVVWVVWRTGLRRYRGTAG